MPRITTLVATAALLLPLPALAAEDCPARIAAIQDHPAFSEKADTARESEKSESEETADDSASKSEEEAVEEQTEDGEAVQENGGTTVYQEGGPAGPRENWFGSPPDKAQVLEHLAAAEEADAAGDTATCIEEVEQAEKIFARETEEEQENEQQAN